MNRTSLFAEFDLEDLRARSTHGATWQVGAWQCRNWHGFFQSRESKAQNWAFQIPWFSHDGDTCTVYVVTPEGDIAGQSGIPINENNEITLRGKQYDHSFWNH